jgi:hypothetical protein
VADEAAPGVGGGVAGDGDDSGVGDEQDGDVLVGEGSQYFPRSAPNWRSHELEPSPPRRPPASAVHEEPPVGLEPTTFALQGRWSSRNSPGRGRGTAPDSRDRPAHRPSTQRGWRHRPSAPPSHPGTSRRRLGAAPPSCAVLRLTDTDQRRRQGVPHSGSGKPDLGKIRLSGRSRARPPTAPEPCSASGTL